MTEPGGTVHISSAVVSVLPGRTAEVAAILERMEGVELFHEEKGRMVIVLEAASGGAVGARLTEIALLDGVVAANLVYEQIETLESLGEAS